MQYKLVDSDDAILRFKFKDIAPDHNGTFSQANGGTEQMYRYLINNIDPKLLDKVQIICSRVRAENLDPNKKKVLWLHDTWDDPESQHLKDEKSRKRFNQLVFVSNYQFQTYHQGLQVPYQNTQIMRNAIKPFENHVKPNFSEQIRLIYHTTPHRGLELLIPAFEALLPIHPNLHLDVYSSFKIYGWEDRDQQYAKLFERCRVNPNITYHGTVPNEEIREALKKAHIFAFPSIWPETSCIAAIEAMSAKVAVVSSDFAALSETLSAYGFMYRWTENIHDNVNRFASLLNTVIENWQTEFVQEKITMGKRYTDALYNWDHRLREWEALLSRI
jgi:UDP-glucose:(glucosyl)LPS alpha-1,2-glucosyltransferase